MASLGVQRCDCLRMNTLDAYGEIRSRTATELASLWTTNVIISKVSCLAAQDTASTTVDTKHPA